MPSALLFLVKPGLSTSSSPTPRVRLLAGVMSEPFRFVPESFPPPAEPFTVALLLANTTAACRSAKTLISARVFKVLSFLGRNPWRANVEHKV